jgi:hypothetical protein
MTEIQFMGTPSDTGFYHSRPGRTQQQESLGFCMKFRHLPQGLLPDLASAGAATGSRHGRGNDLVAERSGLNGSRVVGSETGNKSCHSQRENRSANDEFHEK